MKSIYELEKEQRDALMFWINDLCGKDPIIISDPHGYNSEKGVFQWPMYQFQKT